MQKKLVAVMLFLAVYSFTYAQSKSQDQAVFSGLSADSEENYEFRKKPNIAVLPFIDANELAKEIGFGRTISAMLITALRNNSNFTVIERSELQKIMSEQVLGLSGLTEKETSKIQDLLKVDVILVGDVSLIDNTLHIDARLFDINVPAMILKHLEMRRKLWCASWNRIICGNGWEY